jgi:hypothetical protein
MPRENQADQGLDEKEDKKGNILCKAIKAAITHTPSRMKGKSRKKKMFK